MNTQLYSNLHTCTCTGKVNVSIHFNYVLLSLYNYKINVLIHSPVYGSHNVSYVPNGENCNNLVSGCGNR